MNHRHFAGVVVGLINAILGAAHMKYGMFPGLLMIVASSFTATLFIHFAIKDAIKESLKSSDQSRESTETSGSDRQSE